MGAIVLEQIKEEIEYVKNSKIFPFTYIDGEWWTDDIYEKLNARNSSFMSIRTLKSIIPQLKKDGVLLVKRFKVYSYSRCFYRINETRLKQILDEYDEKGG